MTEEEQKKQTLQANYDKLKKRCEMLTAENKALHIKNDALQKRIDELTDSVQDERTRLLAKIAELKGQKQ